MTFKKGFSPTLPDKSLSLFSLSLVQALQRSQHTNTANLLIARKWFHAELWTKVLWDPKTPSGCINGSSGLKKILWQRLFSGTEITSLVLQLFQNKRTCAILTCQLRVTQGTLEMGKKSTPPTMHCNKDSLSSHRHTQLAHRRHTPMLLVVRAQW